MDGSMFDAVARRLGDGLSRRQALRGLAAGAVASLLTGGAVAEAAEGEAKRCKPKRNGSPCKKSSECCPKKTKNFCAVDRNAGNSDKTCCGKEGAKCGGGNEDGDDRKPTCCADFVCSTNKLDPDDPDFEPNKPGVCERVPDEP